MEYNITTNKKDPQLMKTSILMDQDWIQHPMIQKVINTLGDNPWRFVGGCVRDSLIEKKTYDIDINTPLLPHQTLELFKDYNTSTIGSGHGTIMIFVDPFKVEITTLRNDIQTHGRKATVQFTHSWEEDSNRRDFTINALMMDYKEQKIYDYHGGINDLMETRLEFIGSLDQRVQEDYLRILRYIRFSLRFWNNNHKIQEFLPFIDGLKNVAYERIFNEISLMMDNPCWFSAIKDLKILAIDELLGVNFFTHPVFIENIMYRWALLLLPTKNNLKPIPMDHKIKTYLQNNNYDFTKFDQEILYSMYNNKQLDWTMLLMVESALSNTIDLRIKNFKQGPKEPQYIFPLTGNWDKKIKFLLLLRDFIKNNDIKNQYNKEKTMILENYEKNMIGIQLKQTLWSLWQEYMENNI